MIQIVNATQVRDTFADIINRVTYGGEEFIIERQGKPVALITQVPETKPVDNTISSNIFLSRISKYGLKKAPIDLAEKHDEYTWDK
ncbi:hypothetical protein CO058_02425 [candidate division WWE3 bacterium CG_4_9_14_0_2_um_filter_35_11]|uniref:Antitoxin n=1 Tax=candidate division WWE3 bacterium CG_4_9_14_0_2_um_filter_35_11 TaxID=1975077 RepID=A0A2M8ELK1_UNCKA|nr:MAG: hypothetical protein COV25_02685 [candidate division WWE3 bacterium CG10_big_fil_rev_8_21_14_0_10_35_32]PJC23590.1 MAG: hypothetical protein CO058_02425 [candidate division WWE3 bacterium CG_4_9_14_0_2_um_filter_35_11]